MIWSVSYVLEVKGDGGKSAIDVHLCLNIDNQEFET
jgi:hypothetical protein